MDLDRLLEAALRRVALAPAGDCLALRGSLLTRAWVGANLRKADDIDFIALFPSDIPRARALLEQALALPADDGVRFHLDTLRAKTTWEDTDAPGLRAQVEASAGDERGEVQIDVGFGDPMDPPPARAPYPAAGGPIEVLCVRPETAVAWKLHGLFEFPTGRWRPKDLWDLQLHLEHVPLEPESLRRAIHLAFTSRHTHLSVAERLLDGSMGQSRSSQVAWRAFRRSALGPVPEHNQEVNHAVAEAMRQHVSPLIAAERAGDTRPTLAPGRRFPRITHLAEVMTAIAGRPEFRVWRRGPLVSVVYEIEAVGSFEDPLEAGDPREAWLRAARRECRGLTFDAEGRLLARKLHRFFHLGGRPEVSLEAVAAWPGLIALPKLDGSMVTPVLWEGALLWTTRRGPSPLADAAGAHAQAHTADYEGLIHRLHGQGYSLIFEWCSAEHHLVLRHATPSLTVLAARHTRDGHYLPHDALLREAATHGVPAVRPLPGPLPPLAELAEQVRGQVGREGLVLRAADGRMVKLKSDWYRRLHTCVEHVEQERPLWAVLLRGELEQLLPLLREVDQQALIAYAARAESALEAEAQRVAPALAEARSRTAGLAPDEARRVVSELTHALPAESHSLLFQGLDDPDASAAELVRRMALRRAGSSKGFQRLKAWLQVPDWSAPSKV